MLILETQLAHVIEQIKALEYRLTQKLSAQDEARLNRFLGEAVARRIELEATIGRENARAAALPKDEEFAAIDRLFN